MSSLVEKNVDNFKKYKEDFFSDKFYILKNTLGEFKNPDYSECDEIREKLNKKIEIINNLLIKYDINKIELNNNFLEFDTDILKNLHLINEFLGSYNEDDFYKNYQIYLESKLSFIERIAGNIDGLELFLKGNKIYYISSSYNLSSLYITKNLYVDVRIGSYDMSDLNSYRINFLAYSTKYESEQEYTLDFYHDSFIIKLKKYRNLEEIFVYKKDFKEFFLQKKPYLHKINISKIIFIFLIKIISPFLIILFLYYIYLNTNEVISQIITTVAFFVCIANFRKIFNKNIFYDIIHIVELLIKK